MEVRIKHVHLLKNGPPNETIFVLGPTGRGKTTLVANLLLDEKRFLIFDAKRDYYPQFFSSGENVLVVSSVNELAEAMNNGQEKIIFRLAAVDEASDEILNSALSFVCQFQVANLELPPIAISIDEINRFADSHNWPMQLKEIAERGRDYKIKKIFGAQWFNSIPTWLRSSFSEIYTFQYTESAGLNKLKDFGFDPEQVKNLPAYNCLHSGKNGVEQIRLIPSHESTRIKQYNETEKIEA